MDYFSLTIFSFTCILILQISQSSVASQSPLETYIVHVDMPANQILTESQDLETWYQSYLPTTLVNSNEESRMVYSYHNVFKGFAAKLTAEEVKDMEKMDGFLSATPQSVYQLHTTHSPSFLGLQKATGLWESSKYGEGIVVCVFDTGIKPDHPSFSDQGMSPPPATWKGECEFNSAACNNKLVGARSFSIGGGTPLDEDGHGTHTAGTAVGNFVSGASVYGLGKGVAAGIAPLAHLAVYKVCTFGCSESDILAGMDKAIDDGCNVLSMSLGAGPRPYYIDNIAIGAYKAMEKGIVVSCSAGNSGPYMATVANEAPWIMTVGASTIDRRFKAIVVLGNKVEFIGESVFQPGDINSSELSLVYPGRNTSISPFCSSSSLNGTDVRKKIVVCLVGGGVSRVGKGRAVKNAGGAAMIIVSSPSYANSTFAEAHVLPAAHVGYADGLKIINYIRSSSTPTASIMFNGTTIGDSRAPVMAAFSSRGPAPISPGLLKPDITAPGMNIVAAWPYSVENITNTKSTFNVLSGTSMSCPHISGVAALLKSVHPDWSPAAIKSAMMTTADVVNLGGNPIEDETFLPADIFATGAGHVNPSRANNPGLIYDLQPEDYIPFLCGLNYTEQQLTSIVQRKVDCSTSIIDTQLNYPSMSVILGSSQQTYTRKVTNVGEASSSYKVYIEQPVGVDVKVNPTTLNFSEGTKTLTYQVTFTRSKSNVKADFAQGSLKWISTKHSSTKHAPSPCNFLVIYTTCSYISIAQQTETGEVKSSLETYIVHVNKPVDQSFESNEESRILHAYRHAISGFAVKLTKEDVKEMEKKDGFISARQQNMYSLKTTHSPSFLGLNMNHGYWQDSNYGEGMIIGLLDTGITSGHPSFGDEDMPPPPSKWKGKCASGIACNNKLIGARNFVNKSEPPIDLYGHGTHTSSTAAGNFVRNANVFGQAKGIASGIAPRAHLAMYKVCLDLCAENVISYSIGGGSKPFSEDSLTIGAFRAAQKGIFVSCAAGNEGPYSSTLSNEAPWVLTVGASTIDRQLRATVVLGNRKEFEGQTAFQPNNFPRKRLPLVYPGAEDDEAVYCGCGSLNNTDVTGKIVVSYNAGNISRIEKGQTVKDAGGAAMILINVEDEGYTTMSDMHVIPASHVSFSAGQKIMAYLSSNSKPKATIKFKGTIVGVQNSPSITHFSSRGPNLASPGILKPDTVGPGLSILAAWPDLKNNTHTKSTFSMDTGTSMACPHLSGVAALLKRSHPDWSPAAIKSAIMTTADTLNRNGNQIMDERKKPANVFALGAGHVYPFSGNDPGLVYDIQPKDYIPYLCGLGYNDTQVRMIVQENVKCSTITSIPEAQLNYPSFSVKLHSGHKVYTRTVTNVGEANSTYGHVINNVPGVDIELSPTQLVFTKVNQKLTYQITFRRKSSTPAASSYVEGAIIWVSEHHGVRSPISVQLEHLK
ncbi:serine protease [Lithospermum erythrorhizon]|uniref:Serine protease n=1 Tax=Lithospermum erythrorhizon TaxID=34254 RepID=A0AAV3RIU9_LITER